jgi:membrane associated rhomboid family serine protease
MLSDRSYMRDDDSSRRTSSLTWILCAIAAAFILQNIVTRLFRAGEIIEGLAALSPPVLAGGHGWGAAAETVIRLFTYGFIHDQKYLIHIIAIGLALFFLGRELTPVIGSRRFVGLFFSTLIGGGLLWTAVHWNHPGAVLMGATPAVMGLLTVFALLTPDREITLLLLFVPVTVKPKYVAWTILVVDLFGCIFYELVNNIPPIALAPSAHLGGMAVGWIYWRYFHDQSWRRSTRGVAIELPRWMKRTPPGATPPAVPAPAMGTREHLKAEVDRILDKINSQGFGALSPDEKRLLDDAKDVLSRR